VPFSCSRLASRGSANQSSVDSRIVGASETGFEEINGDLPEADFGTVTQVGNGCIAFIFSPIILGAPTLYSEFAPGISEQRGVTR
jgi:hypothetical protein